MSNYVRAMEEDFGENSEGRSWGPTGMNADCPCRICGKDTLVKTGKTSTSFDGVEHRTFVKCLNERCNCEYTLSTAVTG